MNKINDSSDNVNNVIVHKSTPYQTHKSILNLYYNQVTTSAEDTTTDSTVLLNKKLLSIDISDEEFIEIQKTILHYILAKSDDKINDNA